MRLGPLMLLAAALPGPSTGGSRTYVVDAARSALRVSVGKSGLFSFAGHEHEVRATVFGGRIVADPADLGRSTVELEFQAAGLQVSGKGEPPEDVPKVQEKMLGVEVLDVTRFPSVTFRSTSVKGKAGPKGYDLEVIGELSLHGVTKPLTLPVHVELADTELLAVGRTTLRQQDYGITPISVGGVVKVKNELALDFSIVGRLEQQVP